MNEMRSHLAGLRGEAADPLKIGVKALYFLFYSPRTMVARDVSANRQYSAPRPSARRYARRARHESEGNCAWPQTSLPTALTKVEIDLFLDAFDCTSPEGGRNYAIARSLAVLGLRAGEVARLELEDLNWREGTLRLRRTKDKRVDMLPIPARTGQAIVQYLQRRPTQRSNRALFVRHRPPLDAPLTVEIVYWAMRQAYDRAGIARPWAGTHCLRHSLACHLVNAGTPLKEIADVLRHRSLNTTMIYAKSNIAQLAAVALPWPGRASRARLFRLRSRLRSIYAIAAVSVSP
jgi:integrase